MELKQQITSFIQHCSAGRGLSLNTIKAYHLDLTAFANYVSKSKRKESISEVILERYIESYIHELSGLKPRTIKRKIAVIRLFCSFLVKRKFITRNPANDLDLRVKIPFDLPRTISKNDLGYLLDHLYKENQRQSMNSPSYRRTLRDLLIVELLFSTGLRVRELSDLKVSSISRNEQMLKVVGKGSKERAIPIYTDNFQKIFHKYLDIHPGTVDEYLFLNRNGNKLSTQSIRRIIQNYCRDLEIQKITPHMFRHTVATMMLEEGIDLRYIQRFLGHSSIVTTTVYTHVTENSFKAKIIENHPRKLLRQTLNDG